MTNQEWIANLRRGIEVMEAYLRIRMEMRDWHGVMDAAADLRELEAKLQTLDLVEGKQ
jgi:hypothetical protein